MSRYNIFQAFFMSFYSSKLYRDVAVNWGAKIFLYLFLLLCLAWILPIYKVQSTINLTIAQDADAFFSQIPQMTIKEGELITPENKPYFIKDIHSGKDIAIIDTSGKYTELQNEGPSILVTKNKVISREHPNEFKTRELTKDLNIQIKPEYIKDFLKRFAGFTWIVLFVFAIIGSYLYRLVQAILLALIGGIVSLLTKAHLGFTQLYRIAIIALTPIIVLEIILDYFFPNSFAYALLLYVVLTLAYLFFGVFANRRKNNNNIANGSIA